MVLSWNSLSLPATAQGPTVPVVSSRDRMPHVYCSGIRSTRGVFLGRTAPCRLLTDPQTCDIFSGHLVCHCSGTQRPCAVAWGRTAPFRLLKDPEDFWCRLAPRVPCRLLRIPKDLCCNLGTPCLSLLRDLHVRCCLLGTHCPCRLHRNTEDLWHRLGKKCPRLPLLMDLQDRWYRLETHRPLPAAAQGP